MGTLPPGGRGGGKSFGRSHFFLILCDKKKTWVRMHRPVHLNLDNSFSVRGGYRKFGKREPK